MSNFGLSLAATIEGRKPLIDKTYVASMRRLALTNWVWQDAATIHCADHHKLLCAIGFLGWKAKLVGWGLCTPSHFKLL